ncbi:MAG TPA: hypothetical protein DD723_06045 [Candidatus Omnitrophica bacterium]|nr:MAG: hypothetical protein A2Z81_06730 [Omnitrophica WOR_2 bacterium GWA2_45_18]HBR15086.1 hypothetical protein [Candidatus Omnitrophota bacterium]
MKKYIIFGGGSYLSDIFDLIHANNGRVWKIFQNMPEITKAGDLTLRQRVSLLDYAVEIYENLETFKPEKDAAYVIGCITVHKYVLIQELKSKYGLEVASLIHPRAHLGAHVHVGEGVTVGPMTVAAPNVYLDDFCAVNRAVSLGHDARIGKYSRVGPSVALAGGTRVGDKCSIGISATVLDHVTIGDWSIVGAGALATKDIPERVVAYGAPAKVIRKNEEIDFVVYQSNRAIII